ncbi:MAG: ACT domain-containing protein [Bacteroidaceae bacterium]|nr:ACT domain-containing protein [Bacteroidaceae bacterium]
MELKVIDIVFSVCKVENFSEVDLNEQFVFTGSTDEEHSLVCPVNVVPNNTIERNDGWKAFRVEGVLDFSIIGILSMISTCLAENKISIFTISTFNTDYILTKSEDFERAIGVLRREGYTVL